MVQHIAPSRQIIRHRPSQFSVGRRFLGLFDDDIDDRATLDEPTQLASGVRHVWVAGEAIVAAGRSTGLRPGRMLGV